MSGISLINSNISMFKDGKRIRHGNHLPPHKYIKNISACRTTPTECRLMAEDLRFLKRQVNFHITGYGKRNKTEKERQMN